MENLRSLIKPPRFQGAATPAPWLIRDLVGLPRYSPRLLSSLPSVSLSLSLLLANPGALEVYTGLRHDVDSISPAD